MGGPELILLLLVGGGLYLYHQTQQLPGGVGGPASGSPTGVTVNQYAQDPDSSKKNTPGLGGGGGPSGGSGSIGNAMGNGTNQPLPIDSSTPGAAYSNSPLDGQESYAATSQGEQLTAPSLGGGLPGAPGTSDSVEGQAGQALNPGTLTLNGGNDYNADQQAAGNNFQLTPVSLGSPGGFSGYDSSDPTTYDGGQDGGDY